MVSEKVQYFRSPICLVTTKHCFRLLNRCRSVREHPRSEIVSNPIRYHAGGHRVTSSHSSPSNNLSMGLMIFRASSQAMWVYLTVVAISSVTRRKDPIARSLDSGVFSQDAQDNRGEHDVAILPPLALWHVDLAPVRVNIRDL